MPALWLPPTAQAPRYRPPKVDPLHWDAMLEWESQVMGAMLPADARSRRWTRELRKLDAMLELRKAQTLANVPGVLAGYWHILRPRDSDRASFLRIVPLHDEGAFVEPAEWMFAGLRASDLWNQRAVDDRRDHLRRDAEAQDRDLQRDNDERRDHLRGLVDAVTRTQVNMSPDIPWSQNAAGAKRPTRGRRR